MITSQSFNKLKKEDNKKSFLSKFIFSIFIKTLIVIILFLSSLIYIRQSDKNKEKFNTIVYNNSLSFAKFYSLYKKYLGDVIPFKNIFKNNTKLVSGDKITYDSIEKQDNGYILTVTSNYTISALKSGIVIKKENKDNKTYITIQDKNGLNITYGLLEDSSVSLYDYIEKSEVLGNANEKLYLEFKKDNKYLSYEKYL